jgi:DNA-binding NarL/FixJ family response regulator
MTKVGIVFASRLLNDSLVAHFEGERDLQPMSFDSIADCFRVPDVDSIDIVVTQFDEVMKLREHCNSTGKFKVVVMHTGRDAIDVIGYLRLGVAAFILEHASSQDVVDVVRVVRGGSLVIPDCLSDRLCEQLDQIGRNPNRGLSMSLAELTLRERQVVELVADAMSNKEIADRLKVSTHTVKTHIHSILQKLSVRSRVDLVNRFWQRATPTRINGISGSRSSFRFDAVGVAARSTAIVNSAG